MDSLYDLYMRGCDLLGPRRLSGGDRAVDAERAILSPRRPRSGRRSAARSFTPSRYEHAAREFEAVASAAPTNDYALFCLGRAMQLLGRHREACKPLALACSLQPERADYRLYRDRARRAAHGS